MKPDPSCRPCGGVLKLDTVLFGERLNPSVIGHATAVASATPLLLAVGSSLLVEPAAQLCRIAVDRGARLVIVNRDPTPYDDDRRPAHRRSCAPSLRRVTVS